MLGMTSAWLGRGVLLGFSIAAPVGPIGVLCLRTSLAEGPPRGLAVGLGAATADALYGAVAAFGLTAISSFLVGEKLWLQLGGGAFLLYLGLKTWREKPRAAIAGGAISSARASAAGSHRHFEMPGASVRGGQGSEPTAAKAGSAWGLYASAVGLTLTNPMTILSFVAVFAGFGLAAAPGRTAAAVLVAGVFLGSALWWIILSSSAGYIGRQLGSGATGIISRCSAAVLLAFGGFAIAAALQQI